ncbi:MAG: hypothetical protein OXS30_13325 [Chloroflexota bacterium]|nr:hypothetical protein [Chloroflexota bacterium]
MLVLTQLDSGKRAAEGGDSERAGEEDVAGAGGVGSALGGGEAAAGDRAGQLGGLLQDLLRTHGRRRTAELLGLSERTLQRVRRLQGVERVEAGEQLSEQFLRAPEDYEAKQSGPGALSPLSPLSPLSMETAAELAQLRRRLDRLEQALPENIGDLPGAVERLASTVEELQQQVTAHCRGGEVERPVASVGAAAGIKTTDSPLRQYPELVTIEAEPGERRFYGQAMPTVSAWRRARVRRGQASNTLTTLNRLDTLRADERLLELELELVGEHGLTLPPAGRPWDGPRRQTELRVTREALRRVRRDRRRAQVVHWMLRLLTLGLWGR